MVIWLMFGVGLCMVLIVGLMVGYENVIMVIVVVEWDGVLLIMVLILGWQIEILVLVLVHDNNLYNILIYLDKTIRYTII